MRRMTAEIIICGAVWSGWASSGPGINLLNVISDVGSDSQVGVRPILVNF